MLLLLDTDFHLNTPLTHVFMRTEDMRSKWLNKDTYLLCTQENSIQNLISIIIIIIYVATSSPL